MVKKDKKSKATEKKVRIAQKQDKKATQKDKKSRTKKTADDDSDAEDGDLDAEYVKQQEKFLKVTETICEPPGARASSIVIANPANDNELFLFGGEYFNGALAKFFNDLFVYNINRDEWRYVTSPNTPLPRSGHAWTRGGNAGAIYLFGGEFSSPKQGTFYHYNDFWRLEPSTREWTKLDIKGKGPPARSGHRMTFFKNYIVLYGGFQDTSQQTRYLSDLWLYDCSTFVWHAPSLPPASQKPDPRSSFTFLPHDSGAVLYGGYSRVKSSTPTRPTKGGGASSHQSVLKPLVHQDTWVLRITPPNDNPNSGTAASSLTVRWERRKRPANLPTPARAGATMAYHKGRGIQFGGVHDVEESEEGIESEFFNTLSVWNIERNRYFSLTLRRPRQGVKRMEQAGERIRGGRGKKDEDELLRNLKALQTGTGLGAEERLPSVHDEGRVEENRAKIEKTVIWEMPHPRFNAQLTVQDDVLYIFGGTYEKGDREYTFNDLWAIDLGKLDGVKEIFQREPEDWQGSEDEDDAEDEDNDDSTTDEEDEHDADPDTNKATRNESTADTEILPTAATPPDQTEPVSDITTTINTSIPDPDRDDQPATSSALTDNLPHPRPFEALRDFYARTSSQWQGILLEHLRATNNDHAGRMIDQAGHSIKQVRKGAFERAEEKWWDCREEIRILEDEQEEAGIGEVVSLAEKGGAGAGVGGGGGVGRRR